MIENIRYIDIDEDTRVGYSYIKGKYYVTNKGYTTYRATIPQIQAVLSALDIETIEDSQLEELSSNEETLHSVYYTWNDTGSYIKTIQFNDFKDNPLTLDCEKKKIYIMNSNIVYDLEVNESVKNVRVPYLQSYYRTKLGLYIDRDDLIKFYNLLRSFYAPTVYNQIATPDELEKDPTNLSYTNVFMLSNYDETSPVVYYGTYNALNKEVPDEADYIERVDANKQVITSVVTLTNLSAGDTIILKGAEDLDNLYSADGTYTISAIEETSIYVEEPIPTSYEFPHETCSLISVEANIQSISRDTQTITLTELVPDTIFVGDTIHITGTTITTDYETITCDGSYTVQSIEDTSITVEEPIPTNYTGDTGSIYKEVLLGNIKRIQNNTIYLMKNLTLTILPEAHVNVYDPVAHATNTYTIQSVGQDYITVVETIGNYIPNYPTIQKLVPSSETMITVTKSDLDEFPTGEFLLDNFDQAQAYIQTVAKLPFPSDIVGANLYNKVAKQYALSEPTSTGISYMTLLGLYSKIYVDEAK